MNEIPALCLDPQALPLCAILEVESLLYLYHHAGLLWSAFTETNVIAQRRPVGHEAAQDSATMHTRFCVKKCVKGCCASTSCSG